MLTNESNSEKIFNKIDIKFEEMNNNDNNDNIQQQQQQNDSQQSPQQQQQQSSGFRLQDCETNKTLANNINYLQNQMNPNEIHQQQQQQQQQQSNENQSSFEESLTSNILNNSLMNHHHQNQRRSILSSSTNNNNSDDSNKDEMSLAFSNLQINESNENKFWSLDTSTNEDFNSNNNNNNSNPNQPYGLGVGSSGQSMFPFSEQSLVQKNPIQSNPMSSKLSMNVNYGSSTATAVQPSSFNRPPSVQTSLHSNGLTWSNAFNSSSFPTASTQHPPCLNSYSPNNNISTNNNAIASQTAWSSALYNHQKRNQLPNQNSNININNNNVNQKFRRNPGNMLPPSSATAMMKNYQTCSTIPGQTNIYDLGSAGSDNTSSSSDSANLRENGLFFHDKNFEQTPPILDSFGQNLDPQLCDVLKSSQEANKSMYGYACQPGIIQEDDKKHLKARFNRRRGKSPFFTGNDTESLFNEFPNLANNDSNERFSRKVFVGGLPPDIDEEEITASFRRFGNLVVDWPHKAESKSYFPPKGYAFLLFQEESSVQMLIDTCMQEEDKLYLCVSSPTMKDKPVQIRPWRLSDADYVLDASMPLDPRKTVFVGGVPRPLKAVELAMIMDRLYGGVCYAGIDTDPELKYPKGAGRVAFSNQQSYIAAISARFVQLQHADIEKRVEVKPYVLDDQICDECQGARCNGKFAPYFCANITCLQYYCENCWATIHSRPGREFHKPLVKEGADRPRAIPFRWC